MKSGFKLFCIMLCMMQNMTVSGQYHNKLYDIDGTNDFCSDIRLMADGRLLLTGGALQSSFYSAAASLVLDDTGFVIVNHQLITPPWNYGARYGKMKEIFGGTFVQPVSMYMYNNNGILKGKAGYIEFDSNGEIITVNSFTDTLSNYEASDDFIQLPDSSFLFCGERFYNTYTGIEYAHGFIYKLDKEWNQIWRQIYDFAPPSSLGTFYQSIQYITGNMVVVGSCLRYYQSSTVEYINRPYFALLDTGGNVLYSKFYGSGYRGGGNIYKDKNGGYFHWGRKDSLVIPSDPLEFRNHPGYLAHLDDSFNFVWTYVYYDTVQAPYHLSIQNVLQLSDSGYLVMGIWHQNGGVSSAEAYIGKLSKEGVLLWEHKLHVGDGTYDCYLVDAVEKPDKSLLLVGSAKNASNPVPWNQDFWLVGLDSNGCLVAGCSPTGVVQLPQKAGEVKVYPNPTSGAITASVPEKGTISIVNLQGQVVGAYELQQGNNQLQLSSGLAPGLYMGKVLLANGQQTLVKIVYQP